VAIDASQCDSAKVSLVAQKHDAEGPNEENGVFIEKLVDVTGIEPATPACKA